MSLSRRELEELKPMIDKTVRKFIGFSEPTIVTVAVNCVDKGYDQRKTVDKLLSYLDEGQAKAFSQKLFDTYEEFKALGKHGRTRKRKDETRFDEDENTKRQKQIEGTPAPAVPVPVVPDPGNPSPGQLTADKIKEMMANAQKMISERKAQLGVPEVPVLPKPSPASDLVRRQQELQARIQSQMLITGVGGDSVAAAIAAAAQKQQQALAQQQSKPTPLILDEQGRTIDATTGETIQLQHHMPTLKANIRAKRREQFKAVQEKPPEEISESKFFDPRVAAKGAVRSRRGFRFHEKGKFESLAGKLRTKAQLEKLQNEIAQAAKKTGIASAAKLATIQPKKELREGEIPEVEWWDSVILLSDNYDSFYEKGANKFEGVTFLIEHPTQMRAPAEPTKAPHIPVMLTKKERKKLRRQSRQETQKELTEKIRLGLIPPPEPKVKMSNLMRVLGTEAVQDPTKVEQHVREQMVKRQKAHEEANAARKLTKEERRDKKIAKLQEDTSLGVKVSVYRVRELNNAAKKFKVETNAKQLYMTGFVVLQRDCNVVVVEGGPKQQKKFRRLMMHRIKWDEDKKKSSKKDEDEESDEEEVLGNSCVLVWEGEVKTRAFGEIKFKACPTESFAREQFKKCGVEHYWDLAYSGAVLETAGEEL